jgi:hypothetical protein
MSMFGQSETALENLLNRPDALARPLVEIPGEAFKILFVASWFFY